MWHKVTERPAPYTDLILTDGVHIDMGHYSDAYNAFYWNSIQYDEATHWIKPHDLLFLPGISFDAEEDVENCVTSVVADVTQLEDAVIGIGQGGGIPDERDMQFIRLTHLVLLITHKLHPGISTYIDSYKRD